jgi:hypothetical protein
MSLPQIAEILPTTGIELSIRSLNYKFRFSPTFADVLSENCRVRWRSLTELFFRSFWAIRRTIDSFSFWQTEAYLPSDCALRCTTTNISIWYSIFPHSLSGRTENSEAYAVFHLIAHCASPPPTPPSGI